MTRIKGFRMCRGEFCLGNKEIWAGMMNLLGINILFNLCIANIKYESRNK